MPASLYEFVLKNPAVSAACIAAGAALITSGFTLFAAVINNPLKYWLDNKALAIKLRTEYQHKNISEFQDLTRRYKGLLLEAATALNSRFSNLYINHGEDWLQANGEYVDAGDYFQTFVRRLARVVATATALENEALYIDQSIGDEHDLQLIYMAKSWLYILSTLKIVQDVHHSRDTQDDHLFKDTVKCIGAVSWINGHFASEKDFLQLMKRDKHVRALCHFIDGLDKDNTKVKWDRLVCMHLLIINFLETFGYEVNRTDAEKLKRVIAQISSRAIRKNLAAMLAKWQLINTPSGKNIYALLME